MALPTGQDTFAYNGSAFPAKSNDPAMAEPIGLGSISVNSMTMGLNRTSSSGDTLSIQIGLNALSGPADIYLAVYAPSVNPSEYYLRRPDNTFQALSSGAVKWKSGVAAAIDESLFGDIQASLLPSGTYYIHLLATPEGSINAYYLWATSFEVK